MSCYIIGAGLFAIVLLCSCSRTDASGSDRPHARVTSPSIVAPYTSADGDLLLLDQKAKMAATSRAIEKCRDLQDFKGMVQVARARRKELDTAIRSVHAKHFATDDQDRILAALRQERDWLLEVMQSASAVIATQP